MRIWDTDPALLTRRHLSGEWNELHQLWRAVHKRRALSAGGWVNHPETVRFAERPQLLVGRREFLRREGAHRGYRFEVVLEPAPTVLPFIGHDMQWLAWAVAHDWPWLVDSRSAGAPFAPWHRDEVTYEYYRLIGPYADGVLTLVP